ncbi:MAG: T9SS type A sorting domain-containing protein [bacterium]|nr:T9SS type A sorting domain-containing protein [bacterium]
MDYSSVDGVMTVTIKYNSSGDSVWVARRPTSSPASIAIDNLGNVYVTGGAFEIAGNFNFLTIKYNSNGVFQWEHIYSGAGNLLDFSFALSLDAAGNIYVTGISRDVGYDYVTIKYNPSGDQVWLNKYNAPNNIDTFEQVDIEVDAANNVYILNTLYIDDDNIHFITIKLNSAGVQQWVAIDDEFGIAKKMALDNSGNVFVSGGVLDSTFDYVFATIKYNSSGVKQWISVYPGSSDGVSGIETNFSGDIFVTGAAAADDPNDFTDYVTIKYNTTGASLWVAKYSGIIHSGDFASALALDNSGDVYVTGISSSSNDLYFEFTTVKYSSSGVQKWVARYANSTTANSIAHIIAVDDLNNVFVAGYSNNVTTYQDFATVKYIQDSPLPVELASFTSAVNNNDVILNWSTATEENNSGFDIERSSIVNNEWTKIGFVEGNGTSANQSSYSFHDRYLNTGRYNYRLKQIDFNGNFEYFNLGSEVSIGIPDKFKLSQNYPNPFNPTTKINFSVPVNSLVKLKIYNVLGKEVMTLINEQKQAGNYAAEFNGANLSSGIYFFRMEAGEFVDVKRMMLIK